MSYFYKLILVNENDSCVTHMPFYNNINLIKTCVTWTMHLELKTIEIGWKRVIKIAYTYSLHTNVI